MIEMIRPPREVEAEAHAAGLSMNEVCRRAGVHRSLFTKWKAGQKGITAESYNSLVAVIRAASPSEATAD